MGGAILYSDGTFLELVGVLAGLWCGAHVGIRRPMLYRFLLKPGYRVTPPRGDEAPEAQHRAPIYVIEHFSRNRK